MDVTAGPASNGLLPDTQIFDDPYVAYYRRFVDVEALRANLRLTPAQRMDNFLERMKLVYEQERIEREMDEFERGIDESND